MDHSAIELVLESCEFFNGFTKDNLKEISLLCQEESYQPGDAVFRQGDFTEKFYIIAEGSVFLERSMDLGSRRGNVVIMRLGKGRAFGCWSSLLGSSHDLMSSAVCQKSTKVVVIKGAALREIMLNNRELGFCILERLCLLLRERIQAVIGAMETI